MKSTAPSPDLSGVIATGRSHPVRKWFVIFALLALAIAAGYYYHRNSNSANIGPEYITRPLERGELSIEITATGNLAPTNQVTVGSELSGTIEEVLVDTNDEVKKGQPIAKLDPTKVKQATVRSRAALESALARVTQAEATLKESTANHGRLAELHRISGGKTPSKAEMDTAVATVDRARADVANAKAAVSQAEAEIKANESDLEKTVITSPVDGVVLTRSVEPGQTVAASFTAPTLFVIAEDLRKMELAVAVAEADIGRVEKDQKVEFTVDAWPKRVYHAKVKKVTYGSAVTNNVITYSTELEVENDDLSLRPGMTATAEIFIERKQDVLTVPNSALRFDPKALAKLAEKPEEEGTIIEQLSPGRRRSRNPQSTQSRDPDHPHVWVLRNGKPEEVPVTTGLTDGSRTEISTPDLKEGDLVIISGKPAITP